MRPTPKEISKCPNQYEIDAWIRKASIDELIEFLQQDIGAFLQKHAQTELNAKIAEQARKPHCLHWCILAAAVVSAIAAVVGVVLRWTQGH
jgi:hypothetical protein